MSTASLRIEKKNFIIIHYIDHVWKKESILSHATKGTVSEFACSDQGKQDKDLDQNIILVISSLFFLAYEIYRFHKPHK